MSQSNWELWGIIIAIVEFDINYYVYSATRSFSNIVFIILISLVLALILVISNIYLKLNSLEEESIEREQKLIRYNELEDIRLDLREIKNKLFKRK